MDTCAFLDEKSFLRSSDSLFPPVLPMAPQMIVKLFLSCFSVRVNERVNSLMTDSSSDSESGSELLDSLGNLLGTFVSKKSFDHSITESDVLVQLSDISFVRLFQEIIPVSP